MRTAGLILVAAMLTGCGFGGTTAESTSAASSSWERNIAVDVAPAETSPDVEDEGSEEGSEPAEAEIRESPKTASNTLVFEGGEVGAYDCDGNDVEVRGNINTLVFTGPCAKVTVLGNTNTIIADSITELNISGEVNGITAETILAFGSFTGRVNTVTWQAGVRENSVKPQGNVNTLNGPR